MSFASWALQQALYTALTGDAALTALLASSSAVYAHVPDGAAYPYITIGETVVTDWDTKSGEGQEHELTLHVWSRGYGQAELLQITAALHDLLHEQTLTVSGHTAVVVRQVFATTLRDPDGRTYHAVVRFRVLTESA